MLDGQDSALIMLSADDSVDTAITKLRQEKATQITLLIPDGTRVLQSMGACEKLRQSAQQAGKSITIYSSDEKTCNAAQLCNLNVVRIDASMPTPGGSGASSRGQTGPRAPQPATAVTPFNADDFLASLDDVPATPIGKPAAPIGKPAAPPPAPSERAQPRAFQDMESSQASKDVFTDPLDDDWAAALNEFSKAAIGDPQRSNTPPSDIEWASAFDDLSDAFGSDSGFDLDQPETPRRRFTADDIEITEEDRFRQLPRKQRDKLSRKPGPLARLFGTLAGLRRRPAASADLEDEGLQLEPAGAPAIPRLDRSDQEQLDRDRERRRLTMLPIMVIVGLLLLGGLFWFFTRAGAKAQLSITPPAATQGKLVADVELAADDPDLAALPLQITVSYTASGQVAGETLAPISQARGTVMLANRLTEPITIEKGKTLVKGTNAEGKEVSFYVDADMVVPPAQETFTGFSFGTAQAPVVASAGGGAYNLPAETQLRVEGMEGALNAISLSPIEGGADQAQKIVTMDDVNALLPTMLRPLSNQAHQRLKEIAEQNGKGLQDPRDIPITPSLDTLSKDPESYRIETIPPLGSVTESGEFTLIVSADFTTLATPAGVPFAQRLEQAVKSQMGQLGQASPDDNIALQNMRFSEKLIIVDVLVTPEGGVLSQGFKQEIARTIAGERKAEAQRLLDMMVEQGWISEYKLPEDDPLPTADQIEVVEATP